MFKKIIQSVAVLITFILVIFIGIDQRLETNALIVKERTTVKVEKYVSNPMRYKKVKTIIKNMTKENIDLIALITVAEAEGETEYGKRLVISTILNRLDSEHFPNSVYEVIYQSGAFSCVSNGRLDRSYVTDDIRQLVVEEFYNRTDEDVIFFCANDYSTYGVPMFVEGGHYFSSYD